MNNIPLLRGRMRRTHYWLFSIALYVLSSVIGGASPVLAEAGLQVGVAIALVFVVILPALIIGVRRAHDIGSSKYAIVWAAYMLFYAFAVVAQAFLAVPAPAPAADGAGLTPPEIVTLIFVIIFTLAFAVLNLMLLFSSGKVGPNQFGPDPRGRAAPANA